MSKMSRKKFLKSVQNYQPRAHQVEQSILDGKIGRDNMEGVVDDVSYVDEEGVTWSIRNVSHKTCDFGHLQDRNARFLSECKECGKITCSTPGCGFTCTWCGNAFCRRHVSVYADGQAYCADCKWHKHVRIFLGFIGKVVK